MGGTDLEFLDHWHYDHSIDGYAQLVRNKPAKLRDREALKALLSSFGEYAGSQDFMLDFDDVGYDSTLPSDALLDRIPSRVSRMHLQAKSAGLLVVHLSSQYGGRTWVAGSAEFNDGYGSAVQRLAGLVEANGQTLRWTRVLGRSARPSWMRRLRPSILVRSRRDDLEQRRSDSRTAVVGAASGLISGIILNVLVALLAR